MTKADRTHARFLAHCKNRQRLLDELDLLHTKMAALTDRENTVMCDLDRVNHAIDTLFEQRR